MAKSLALAMPLLAAPCAAFVSQGNLRAQAPATPSQAPADAQVPSQSSSMGAGVQAAAIGMSAVGLAALASAKASKQQRASRVERRVVGVCLPLTEKFDPLNLGNTDAKMERYTAVEIKHGRVAMIATMGYFLPEAFRFPGCEGFSNGLGALSTLPTEGWIQLVAFIGAHEVLVKPRAGGMGAYDFGIGTELLDGIEDEELERRQTVERNNGRLAMVAILGLMWQDGTFGKTPIALIKSDGFWGPPVDFIIKDIPMCMGGSMCATKQSSSRVARTAMRAEGTKMSPSMPFLKYPEVLDGWVGGEKGFDPLGVTDALPVYFCREAELKHARVCMLATVGWIATDLGARFPGDVFQSVSTLEAHDKMVTAGIMGPMLATVGVFELYGGWLCLEGWEGKVKRQAGDFFLGKNFLPKDEAKAKEMQLKELENGRLAMLAFAGIVTQAATFKTGWPFL